MDRKRPKKVLVGHVYRGDANRSGVTAGANTNFSAGTIYPPGVVSSGATMDNMLMNLNDLAQYEVNVFQESTLLGIDTGTLTVNDKINFVQYYEGFGDISNGYQQWRKAKEFRVGNISRMSRQLSEQRFMPYYLIDITGITAAQVGDQYIMTIKFEEGVKETGRDKMPIVWEFATAIGGTPTDVLAQLRTNLQEFERKNPGYIRTFYNTDTVPGNLIEDPNNLGFGNNTADVDTIFLGGGVNKLLIVLDPRRIQTDPQFKIQYPKFPQFTVVLNNTRFVNTFMEDMVYGWKDNAGGDATLTRHGGRMGFGYPDQVSSFLYEGGLAYEGFQNKFVEVQYPYTNLLTDRMYASYRIEHFEYANQPGEPTNALRTSETVIFFADTTDKPIIGSPSAWIATPNLQFADFNSLINNIALVANVTIE